MKVVIFSDVHGNLPALKLMLDDAGKADLYISLGDVVNYGPWSNECVDLLDKLNSCIKILGNHEEFFLVGKFEGENIIVKSFFDLCFKDFTEFDSLKSYIKNYDLGKYKLSHTINNQYIYPDSKIDLDRDYIIGHTHYQFSIESNGHVLFNTGSVGQNREFINVINYLILDTETDKVDKRSIIYDVDLVIREMEKRKYPKECIEYYKSKKRFQEWLPIEN